MAKHGDQVIQMYAAAAGDAIANIDVPDDGLLMAIYMKLVVNGAAADSDRGRGEISFGSTSSFATNDSRQVLANIMFGSDLVGTAANVIRTDVTSEMNFPNGVKVSAGERIYMHTLASGVTIGICYAHLVFSFLGAGVARRR